MHVLDGGEDIQNGNPFAWVTHQYALLKQSNFTQYVLLVYFPLSHTDTHTCYISTQPYVWESYVPNNMIRMSTLDIRLRKLCAKQHD